MRLHDRIHFADLKAATWSEWRWTPPLPIERSVSLRISPQVRCCWPTLGQNDDDDDDDDDDGVNKYRWKYYKYVCMGMYIRTCLRMYVCIYVYTVYVYMYVFSLMQVFFVCMYVCMYCMYVCMYVCMHIFLFYSMCVCNTGKCVPKSGKKFQCFIIAVTCRRPKRRPG